MATIAVLARWTMLATTAAEPPVSAVDLGKSSASADGLAKQQANPVAALISLSVKNNFDVDCSANEGWNWTLKVQSVFQFSLSEGWYVTPACFVNQARPGCEAKD